MADNKKPDYTDFDWTELIRDRTAKWQRMLVELTDENLCPIDIWGAKRTEAFTP